MAASACAFIQRSITHFLIGSDRIVCRHSIDKQYGLEQSDQTWPYGLLPRLNSKAVVFRSSPEGDDLINSFTSFSFHLDMWVEIDE